MKIKDNSSLLIVLYCCAFLIVNTAYGQEVNRKYVLRDRDSEDTVFSGVTDKNVNVMPARVAEKGWVNVEHPSKDSYEGETSVMIKFSNLGEPPRWAGVVFPVEANYWGEWPLASPSSALDLSKAKRLVFYARGDRGGERIQVKAAIAGDKPYGDRILSMPLDKLLSIRSDNKKTVKEKEEEEKKYYQSVAAPLPIITDWITLERNWNRYDVKIENAKQYKRVITPFAVITNFSYNPEGSITVYLDEIYYELEN